MAKQIIDLMPPHLTYCEPFFGGGSVMLAKPFEGINEVANDINQTLMKFWSVLAHRKSFAEFVRTMEATPFSESAYEWSGRSLARGQQLTVDEAVSFFVRCRQSLAGRMDSFAPLSRTRTRRGMNEQVSAWLTTVEGLPAVHARLKRVAITNRPAVKCIKDLDDPQTLFYCDPPYLKETRTAPDVYQHEMTEQDHENLLEVLSRVTGKFILSGYPSELYTRFETLNGWRRVDIEIDNKAAGGKSKRKMTECLWMNYQQ